MNDQDREADKLCPRCGTEEWDRITNRTSPGAAFNRCNRCENEWEPVDNPPMAQSVAERQRTFKAAMKAAGFVKLEAWVMPEQREKFRQLGGDEWLRERINKAKPKEKE